MKNLPWSEAKKLARRGYAVRREQGRKWLTFESYVWLITQPQIPDEETMPGQDYRRDVCQNFDHAAAEWLANDWTDEPWKGGGDGPHGDPVDPEPPTGDPENPTGDPENPTGDPIPPNPGGDGADDEEDDGGTSGGGNNGGGTGGGSSGGGIVIFPPPPQPPPPPPHPQPPVSKKPKKPGPNDPGPVPIVTVTLTSDLSPDGPQCWITPPSTCTITATVSIAGGSDGVGMLSVGSVGPGGTDQNSTAHSGYSGDFTFSNVLWTPGGTITFQAQYTEPGSGQNFTGDGEITFDETCLIVTATFTGSQVESKSCEHEGGAASGSGSGGPPPDGYTYEANYMVMGQYAATPTPGTAVEAKLQPIDMNAGDPHYSYTYTELPSGTVTSGDVPITVPDSITIDVIAGTPPTASNAKAPLDIFGDSEESETENPHCEFSKVVSETITVA